jgi:hypothetical protein
MAQRARYYGDIRAAAIDWLGQVKIDADRVDHRPRTFSGWRAGQGGRPSVYRLPFVDLTLGLKSFRAGTLFSYTAHPS